MNIIYLHGLGSDQGGDKVSFLSDNGYVFAPEMDYQQNENIFPELLEEIKTEHLPPDLIIGSSMGGYFAYVLASHFENTPVLLFNPAFHSRSINPNNIYKGPHEVKGVIALGDEDNVVPPKKTIKFLTDNDELNNFEIINMEEIGHQIPLYVFRNIYNKLEE
tara:strand:- start:111 stop:596 length:486 start_codon:yes stop_codon:yes gene_type:complete